MIVSHIAFLAVVFVIPTVIFLVGLIIAARLKHMGGIGKTLGLLILLPVMLGSIFGAYFAYDSSILILTAETCDTSVKRHKLPFGEGEIEYENFGVFDTPWVIIENQTETALFIHEELYFKRPEDAQNHSGSNRLDQIIPVGAAHGFNIQGGDVYFLETPPDEISHDSMSGIASIYEVQCEGS